MLLKTYTTDFNNIIITFMEQNGWPLKIEDKAALILGINKYRWHVILQNQEQENM